MPHENGKFCGNLVQIPPGRETFLNHALLIETMPDDPFAGTRCFHLLCQPFLQGSDIGNTEIRTKQAIHPSTGEVAVPVYETW